MYNNIDMEEGTLFTSNLDDYNIGIDLLNQLLKETSCNGFEGDKAESSFVDELIGLNNTTYGYSSNSYNIALPELADTKMCVSNDQEGMLLVHETCNVGDCTRKPSYHSICSDNPYREDCTSYDSLCGESDSLYREGQEKEHSFQYSYNIDIEDHGKNCQMNGEDSIGNTPTIYTHNCITSCNDHIIGEQVLRTNLACACVKCSSQYLVGKQSYYDSNVCAQEPISPSTTCSWENSSCNSTSTSALEPNAISIKQSSTKKRTRREANLCSICNTSDHECVCDDQYIRSLAISRLGDVCSATTTDTSNERSWRDVKYAQAALQVTDWHGIVTSAAASRPKRSRVRISSHPQTAAARHRRERISLRFRILQRLVPGCTHMDTASMLDETIHYLKFLKAQLQALECLEKSSLTPSSISSTLPNSYAIPNDLNSIALCSY